MVNTIETYGIDEEYTMKEFIIKDYPDTFNTINDYEVIVKIDPQSNLSDVLESFERFLQACGYVLSGHLEIVPEFECQSLDNEDDLGEDE